MTSKEAFETLKRYEAELLITKQTEVVYDAVISARSARYEISKLVERDTPMKVNSHAGSIFREYKCQCGQHFNSFYHLVEINFCPKCGQRLDWSE